MIYNKTHIIELLKADGASQQKLFEQADKIRKKHVSADVYFRALIEFSNICKNDCYYCGIRKSNKQVSRYTMSAPEIRDSVALSYNAGLRSLVLQSGERQDKTFTNFVKNIVAEIKQKYPDMGITLCVGEQSKDVYKDFFDAGAHRYLLRIEASNEKLYNNLHPEEMDFINRKRCLDNLKDVGFQTGTGVLIGAPYQSYGDLADDLLFMQKMDIHMAGMGPYIPHESTPLFADHFDRDIQLSLGLNMIAVLRLMMPDINIAATTALETLHHQGRELGIKAGANVVMPQMTPQQYREGYLLYKDKPVVFEQLPEFMQNITNLGYNPVIDKWGDSRRFVNKQSVRIRQQPSN